MATRGARTQRHVDALRRGARAAGYSSARTAASGPLRRVVEETSAPMAGAPDVVVPRLLLECGHLVSYPRGPFGAQGLAGARRRCRPCGDAAAQPATSGGDR